MSGKSGIIFKLIELYQINFRVQEFALLPTKCI